MGTAYPSSLIDSWVQNMNMIAYHHNICAAIRQGCLSDCRTLLQECPALMWVRPPEELIHAQPPMHVAARQAPVLMRALSKLGIPIDQRDGSGCTALMVLIQQLSPLSLVKQTLKLGADPSAQDDNGVSCLMRCCMVDSRGRAEVLLASGGDPLSMDRDGSTSIEWAESWSSQELVSLLSKAAGCGVQTESFVPLSKAVELLAAGDMQRLEDLLARFPRLGQDQLLCDGGSSPLLHCAVEEHPEQIEALVKMGVEVDQRDTLGDTALAMAISDGAGLETIDLLLRLGADPNAENESGETPFARSCSAGHLPAAKRLFRAGANPRHRDISGSSCLDWTRQWASEAFVSWLEGIL